MLIVGRFIMGVDGGKPSPRQGRARSLEGGGSECEWCLKLSHDWTPTTIELPGTKDAKSLLTGGQCHEMDHSRGSSMLTEKR